MIIVIALALAQANPPLDCSNPITQADMNQCSASEFRRADAELNRAWAQARAEMQRRDRETRGSHTDGRPGYFAVLLESQRAWLRYRDTQCTVDGYAARGGSMEPMLVSSCRTHLTNTRIEQLAQLIEDRD